MKDKDREILRQLILEKALKKGEFKLSSGGVSSYYFDGKQITLSSDGAASLARMILRYAKEDRAQAVGGLTLGADPIVGSVLALAPELKLHLEGFIVRKEPKGHGTRSLIEGQLTPGSRVIIVDDVITQGTSTFKAIEEVEKLGCRVARVMALVDRQEGGGERLIEKGYRFSPIFQLYDLGVNQNEKA